MAKRYKNGNDYRHIDKDPILDVIRTIAEDAGDKQLRMKYLETIAYNSGVSASTLYSWFHGDTKRPQSLTVRFVLQALDCKMVIQRSDGSTVKGHY